MYPTKVLCRGQKCTFSLFNCINNEKTKPKHNNISLPHHCCENLCLDCQGLCTSVFYSVCVLSCFAQQFFTVCMCSIIAKYLTEIRAILYDMIHSFIHQINSCFVFNCGDFHCVHSSINVDVTPLLSSIKCFDSSCSTYCGQKVS